MLALHLGSGTDGSECPQKLIGGIAVRRLGTGRFVDMPRCSDMISGRSDSLTARNRFGLAMCNALASAINVGTNCSSLRWADATPTGSHTGFSKHCTLAAF